GRPRNPDPGPPGEGGGPQDTGNLPRPRRAGASRYGRRFGQVPGTRENPLGRIGARGRPETAGGPSSVLSDSRGGPHGLVVQRSPRVWLGLIRSRTCGPSRCGGALRGAPPRRPV